MAMPSAENPAQMAMARARSVGTVKTLVTIDRVAGMMSAAPTPMTQRMAISEVGLVAVADSDRAHAEDGQPDAEAPCGDRTGHPGDPAVSSRPAKTRV